MNNLKTPPFFAILITFGVLMIVGMLFYADQLGHFWTNQDAWNRRSVFVRIHSGKANTVSIESSTGFTGRWERGSDPSDTMRRLSLHLRSVIAKDQLAIGIMKKPILDSTTLLIKLDPFLTYGDFKPLLSAIQAAKIDKYGFL